MKPSLRTVGCFVEYDGKFLILHRHAHKKQGGTWGLPAGKLDSGESDLDAVMREVREETGIIQDAQDFTLLGVYQFDFSHLDLTFPTYRVRLDALPTVTLSPTEHQAFRWVTPKEAYAMPDLIEGFHDLLGRVGYITT